jgi:hypothetical protein
LAIVDPLLIAVIGSSILARTVLDCINLVRVNDMLNPQ